LCNFLSTSKIATMSKKVKDLKKYQKALLLALVILLVVIFENLLLMIRYNRINKYSTETIGVSYSQVQAERYEGDWREGYIAMLDELGFKNIRLAAYWNRIEPRQGEYEFAELDWMISEASKRDAKITLVVGQKNIRYPECFYPDWVDTSDTSAASKYAIDMVKQVVEHYKNNPNLAGWQLENEFLLKSFGSCPGNLLTNLQLSRELDALKSVDSTRPVTLTQSDQFGFPLKGPFGDWFGFSMYRWHWNKQQGYWKYPQNGTYFWWKASVISALLGQNIKIHELQAEAWGPVGNETLSYEESTKSMSPKQFYENIQYARDTKIKNFDLWGAEWWWHMKQSGRPEMWDAVKGLKK